MRVKVGRRALWTPDVVAAYRDIRRFSPDLDAFASWWTVYCLLLDRFEGLA